jgi:ribosomally synthesized peptide
MSQRGVEQMLGKLVTDEGFRDAFHADPDAATRDAGLVPAGHETAALRRIPAEALDAFAAQLDGRICRLYVAGSPEPGRPSR